MRKIVAGLFVSLDGVVESPESWNTPYFDEEMGAVVGAQMADSDTMLLGRVTYELFAGFWPGSEDPAAAYMNGTPKLVASTTLDRVDWANSTLIEGDVAEALTALKERPGGNVNVVGSVSLVESLLGAGVLDELSLLVHPIVVGKGRRLFESAGRTLPLELASSRQLASGVLHAVYRRAA